VSETEESTNFSTLKQIKNFRKMMKDIDPEFLPVLADVIQACMTALTPIDELYDLLGEHLPEDGTCDKVIGYQRYNLLKLMYEIEEAIARGYMYVASVMGIEVCKFDGEYKAYFAADRDWVDVLTFQGQGKTAVEAINDLISKKGDA